MLNNIRNFSKTLFAKILLVIIIIPFVFWGMGGVFNRGNTNNIAKINNHSISAQDFLDYLNKSRIDSNKIKENIENNILEELLSVLISETLIDLEIKKLNLHIDEKALAQKIKDNKNFLDDNGKFSRTKYEKFLISKNLNAVDFESSMKDNELKKQLFSYVSGGIKSPFFLTNNLYKFMNGKLEIDYINLENVYKKKIFSSEEFKSFVDKNKDKLFKEYIDFSYVKIYPKDLTGNEEFNELFFKKIDEIENKILNEANFKDLINEVKLKPITKNNYIPQENNESIEQKIYSKRMENKFQLIEENEFFVLYEIEKINKILPSLEDENFKEKINIMLHEKNKFAFNNKLINQINSKNFNNAKFDELADGKIEKINLRSINDDIKFNSDSVKLLYNRPINSFSLVADKDKNVYLAKITKINTTDINTTAEDFINYNDQTNNMIKDGVYSSYDFLLNNKYEININQKTLERVKNYFQ